VDNLPALSTANHPKVTGQTKHIALRYFRIRDYCGADGEPARLRCLWVPTKLNPADFFSKIVSTPDFLRLVRWIVDAPRNDRVAYQATDSAYCIMDMCELPTYGESPCQLYIDSEGHKNVMLTDEYSLSLFVLSSFFDEHGQETDELESRFACGGVEEHTTQTQHSTQHSTTLDLLTSIT